MKMLLQPGITAALTIGKDLMVEALQGEQFAGPVGKFPDGVIDFDFEALVVRFINISFHLFGAKKRIVNKRINVIGMMNVDDIGTDSGDF